MIRKAPQATLTAQDAAKRRKKERRRRQDTWLSPRQTDWKAQWDNRIDPVLDEMNKRPTEGVSPYDQRANYFKREVYRVICDLTNRSHGDDIIESALLAKNGKLPISPTYKDNPFFWGLKAMPVRANLEAHQITRMSQEMMYAFRHKIRHELFLGFVLQTGAARIYKKRPTQVEEWFVASGKV